MGNPPKWGSSKVMILGNIFQKSSVNRKSEKRKIPRNYSRRKSDGNPTDRGRKLKNGKFPKMGLIESDDSGKYFSKKCRKIVKLEKRKPIVIVVGENQPEIRPIGGASSKMGNSPKWGSSKVVILGNTFRKSAVKS